MTLQTLGPVALTWQGREFYAGRVYLGRITHDPKCEGTSHAWMTILHHKIPNLYQYKATEAEARAALEVASLAALMGEPS